MNDVELTKENIIKCFETLEGFNKYNNIHIEKLDNEEAILYADINKNSLNPSEIVHGGLIFGLADTAMGALCYSTGKKAVTIDSNINYLKPCKGKIIKCVATPIKVGKTIGVYKADVYNSKNELSATVTANYMFLD
jgi:acyl-CoA thioesterase